MDLIITLLRGIVEGMIWGIVFLFLAVLLLPDRIFATLLKRIKPDFISRSLVFTRIKTVLDYLLNKKDVVIEDLTSLDIKAKQRKIADLIKEKTILENNLFFLDLLKSLTTMTYFSVLHSGYGEGAVVSVLEQSMEYLQHYAIEIKNSESFANQRERIDMSASLLQQQVSGITSFLSTDAVKDKVKKAITSLKQNTNQFDSFMRAEYESTRVQLSQINQILADHFMEYIGHGI